MSKLDTKIITEKLQEIFNKLDSAAKIKIVLGFVLRNVETGEYRYCYAHESNTLFKKLPLLLLDGSLFIEKFDIVEQCTQERQITKLRFNLITNVTIFAALLKNIPMN